MTTNLWRVRDRRHVLRRVLAFVASAALLATLTSALSFRSVSADNAEVLFEDSFDTGLSSGWNTAETGIVQNGQYTLEAGEYNYVQSIGARSEFQVSADVAVTPPSGQTGNACAAVVLKGGADGKSGFEFGIGTLSDGKTTFIRVLLREADGTATVLSQKYTAIPGVSGGKVAVNTAYKLSMMYLNGSLICTINSTEYARFRTEFLPEGYAALRADNATGTFDNLQVFGAPAQEVVSIKAQDVPAAISRSGKLDFNVLVTYNSLYGTECIPADDPRVQLSDFDRTLPDGTDRKTVTATVTVGGQTDHVTFDILRTLPEEALSADDFSVTDSFDKSPWAETVPNPNGYSDRYEAAFTDGRVYVDYPSDMPPTGPAVTWKAVILSTLSNSWRNYAVEADVRVTSDATTKTKRLGSAGINLAQLGSEDYNFRVQSDGNVFLYRHTVLLGSTTLAALGIDFNPEAPADYRLRAEVYDDIIVCYVNDRLAIVSTNFHRDQVNVYAGLRATNGSCEFDNFKVTQLEVHDYQQISSLTLYDAAGMANPSFEGAQLSIEGCYLLAAFTDGSQQFLAADNTMLGAYNPTGRDPQTVPVTCGSGSTTLTYQYANFLFQDNFDGGMTSPLWEFPVLAHYDFSHVTNGVFTPSFTRPAGNNTSSYPASLNIAGSGTWSNYSISVDFAFDSAQSPKGKYFCVFARQVGTSRYEFRLYYTNTGVMSGELLRFNDGASTKINGWTETQMRQAANLEGAMGTGVLYNLKLTVVGNEISCYLNGALLGTVDETGNPLALTVGSAGLRLINTGPAIDNVIVTSVQPKNAVSLELQNRDGRAVNSVRLYQGFELEPTDYQLKVTYDDNSTEVWDLTFDMMGSLDTTTTGNKTLTITYDKATLNLPVSVEARTAHLAAFAQEVNRLAAKTLTADDKQAVDALRATFNALSPYEITSLDDVIRSKYQGIDDAMDLMLYPALAQDSVIFRDDFSEVVRYAWAHNFENNTGAWLFKNGYLMNDQRTYALSGTGWALPSDVNARVTSVQADVMLLSADSYVGVGANVSSEGYYHTRLTNKNRSENGDVAYALQLYKKTGSGGQKKLAEVLPAVYGIDIRMDTYYTLRMTTVEGMIHVYINDVEVLVYDDSTSGNVLTTGGMGLRCSEGNGRFDNFKAWGEIVQEDVYVPQITPVKYSDNFEDETIGSDPSHWLELSTDDSWKVVSDGADGKAYGTENRAAETSTWLHGFEKDPVVSLRMKVGAHDTDARVGLLARMISPTNYLKVGYDFAQRKWYIQASQGVNFETQIFYAANTSSITEDTWYNLKLTASRHSVYLTVNGATAIQAVDCVDHMSFGRVGVFTDGAALMVDDVSVEFKNGGAINDGVMEVSPIAQDTSSNYFEVEAVGGSSLVGFIGSRRFLSEDLGQTWAPTSDYNGVGGSYYSSVLQLDDGTYIQVLNGSMLCQTSPDMKTWTTVGLVVPEEEQLDVDGNSVAIFHVNSLTRTILPDGKTTRIFIPICFRHYNTTGGVAGHHTRVYYSDDFGKTWIGAETDTRSVTPFCKEGDTTSWSESKVVPCADGTLRLYFTRNEYGNMVYTESHDLGKTWEGFYPMPQFQCAKSSFSVCEDPYNPGTWYLTWVNDSPTSLGSLQNRTRISLARSTDGMNWEFLMDLERMDVVATVQTAALHQILDPSILVDHEYVYVTYGRSVEQSRPGNNVTHNEQRARLTRIDKSKLKALPWDDATLADSNFPAKVEIGTAPQLKYGLNDLFTLEGGTLKVTALNGRVTEIPMLGYNPLTTPDMYSLGKKTVTLSHPNGFAIPFEIRIVPYYDVAWEVLEGGEVNEQPFRLMEDDTPTYELTPYAGYRVKSVTANGMALPVTDSRFTLPAVRSALDIRVKFEAVNEIPPAPLPPVMEPDPQPVPGYTSNPGDDPEEPVQPVESEPLDTEPVPTQPEPTSPANSTAPAGPSEPEDGGIAPWIWVLIAAGGLLAAGLVVFAVIRTKGGKNEAAGE